MNKTVGGKSRLTVYDPNTNEMVTYGQPRPIYEKIYEPMYQENVSLLPYSYYVDPYDDVKKDIVKYYYKKLFKKWLKSEEYKPILGYFRYNDNKVSLIKDLDSYKLNPDDSDSVVEKKIDYIKDMIDMREVKNMLNDFIDEENIYFIYITQKDRAVKRFILEKLEKYIRREIRNKN